MKIIRIIIVVKPITVCCVYFILYIVMRLNQSSFLFAASNNYETVKMLKQIYADFRDAAEIYAKVWIMVSLL